MAARTKTRVSPKYKTKYHVKNWAAYDIALRARGDITVWLLRASCRGQGTKSEVCTLHFSRGRQGLSTPEDLSRRTKSCIPCSASTIIRWATTILPVLWLLVVPLRGVVRSTGYGVRTGGARAVVSSKFSPLVCRLIMPPGAVFGIAPAGSCRH